jgi:hypothetical protein
MRAIADGGSRAAASWSRAKQALVEAPKPGDGREQTTQARVAGEGRRAQAEARTQAKAARAQAEAAQAQADLAEAKVKVAKEQDAAIARALQEDDEARRQADLKEVAEKEAEAVPHWPPDPPPGRGSG